MQLSETTAVILIAIVSFAGILFLRINSRRHRRTTFLARTKIDLSKLFRERYATQGIAETDFLRAWSAVANAYDLDPALLRPTDSFDEDLGKLDAWNAGEGVLRLEDQLKELGLLNRELGPLHTVEDFVKYYCRVKVQSS